MHADLKQKGPPLVFASDRGPLCTCERKGSNQWKAKKEKRMNWKRNEHGSSVK